MLLLNSIGGAAWETKSETPASLPTHPRTYCTPYFSPQKVLLLPVSSFSWSGREWLAAGCRTELWLVSCDKRSHNLCYNRVQFFSRKTSVGAYLGYWKEKFSNPIMSHRNLSFTFPVNFIKGGFLQHHPWDRKSWTWCTLSQRSEEDGSNSSSIGRRSAIERWGSKG